MPRIAAVALALLTAVLALAPPAPANNRDRDVTVMTRNIYLGGDITRPLRATGGLSGLPALIAFGNANHTLAGIVAQTDFPARAKLLAREIDETEPDLIGLQEVARWSHGPLELGAVGVANATIVDQDFLAILLDELRARGERYEAVEVQEESDVEGPAFASFPGDPTSRDVRLTMRDVILRRTGAPRNLKVTASGSGQYAARIPFSISGVTYEFIRGYNWADVKHRGRSFRFVNTHLESQTSGIALQQAAELLGGAAAQDGKPVVIACDCNSDPLDPSTKPPDPTPHWQPYRLLTGSFTDAWLTLPGAGPGDTSGLSERVNDADASRIDHRIDLILSRDASGFGLPASNGTIVGTDPANRSPAGLWPSDHAGVVVDLTF